jgi:hypothetical protein
LCALGQGDTLGEWFFLDMSKSKGGKWFAAMMAKRDQVGKRFVW